MYTYLYMGMARGGRLYVFLLKGPCYGKQGVDRVRNLDRRHAHRGGGHWGDAAERGTQVDVCRARKARDVDSYDAVVVGASVHMGKLVGEIARFARRHRDVLAKVPVAHFIVCLSAAEETEENCEAMAGYLEALRQTAPNVEPVDTALFAGAVLADTPEYRRLFPLLKIPVKAMAEQPDHRDWEAIRAWAEGLRPKLFEAVS